MQELFSPALRLLADVKNTLDRLVKAITEYQQADTTRAEQEAQAELKAVVRLPAEVTEYYRSEQRERPVKNRDENIRMAFEGLALLAAICLAILTFSTLVTLKGQLTQMQRQTCIQQQASINAERAWVGLAGTPQVEVSSLQQQKFTANIQLTLQNFGKGPALNASAGGQFALHGHVQEVQNATCNLIFPMVGLKPTAPVASNLGDLLTKTQWGTIIFPNQPVTESVASQGKSADILNQEVFLVGCIVYRDQFEEAHWTKFSYSTGPFVTQAVRDASAFRHLYTSSANNYTDDAEKKQSCPN